MHELKLYEVQKKYKDKTAVKQVSYTFKHGVYGLLGENGAGKTTLMRLICGVLQPTTGNIYYDGMEIAQMGAEYRRLLGYLQFYSRKILEINSCIESYVSGVFRAEDSGTAGTGRTSEG